MDTQKCWTKSEFRSLLGQLWHYCSRDEMDEAAICFALLETALTKEQQLEMLCLLPGELLDYLSAHSPALEAGLRVTAYDDSRCTLRQAIWLAPGRTVHVMTDFMFVARSLAGLGELLTRAETALTLPVLSQEEVSQQHNRDAIGKVGRRALQEQVLGSYGDIPWQMPPLPLQAAASPVDSHVADEKAKRAAEERSQAGDHIEARVLRHSKADDRWLQLTDCFFNSQGKLTGYSKHNYHWEDLDALHNYLTAGRHAFTRPVLNGFDSEASN